MEEHIRTLIMHGARLMVGEEEFPLTVEFYRQMVADCRQQGRRVRAFGLVMPGLEEYSLLLAIWANGHVDSGCEDTVSYCMKEHHFGEEARA